MRMGSQMGVVSSGLLPFLREVASCCPRDSKIPSKSGLTPAVQSKLRCSIDICQNSRKNSSRHPQSFWSGDNLYWWVLFLFFSFLFFFKLLIIHILCRYLQRLLLQVNACMNCIFLERNHCSSPHYQQASYAKPSQHDVKKEEIEASLQDVTLKSI